MVAVSCGSVAVPVVVDCTRAGRLLGRSVGASSIAICAGCRTLNDSVLHAVLLYVARVTETMRETMIG